MDRSPTPEGRSLELYFIDGRPDGMLTAEVFNWTGHVLMTPRIQIGDALRRKEARYTGVYLLTGEKKGEPWAYIGEGQDIGDRIRSHDANKDWWDTAVLITTASNVLHKAHVQYLEARLVEEAHRAGQVKLDNAANPAIPGLTEAARVNMEVFLDYVLMILPAIRVDCFVQKARSTSAAVGEETDVDGTRRFVLRTAKHGIEANARVESGEFIVARGSFARRDFSSKSRSPYGKLHAELKSRGVLGEIDAAGSIDVADGLLEFKQDYAFKSPSAAAAIVNGRTSNGTIEWKTLDDGKTYKQWEAERLARISHQGP